MHPASREAGFGRVFRSPTLFEDMVKCILLCNCQLSLGLLSFQPLSYVRARTHVMVETIGELDIAVFHFFTVELEEIRILYYSQRWLNDRVTNMDCAFIISYQIGMLQQYIVC